MRFLPQTTPDAPPPPPPTVLSFLSLSLQTFLEVFIVRAETAAKFHFISTSVMFFLLFDFGIIHHICDQIHAALEMGQRQVNWLDWERRDKLLKPVTISCFFFFCI